MSARIAANADRGLIPPPTLRPKERAFPLCSKARQNRDVHHHMRRNPCTPIGVPVMTPPDVATILESDQECPAELTTGYGQ